MAPEQQLRDDKALLIMNLRQERDDMVKRLHHKEGIMFTLARDYIDTRTRQIAMVSAIPVPSKP